MVNSIRGIFTKFMDISRIKEIAELKERIGKIEIEVLAPKLTDISHIPMIYEWICEFSKEISGYPKQGTPDANKRALFCFIALYSPRSFTDTGFMIRGLRDEIAKLFNLSGSHISNLSKDLAFHHKIYSDYRNDVDTLLQKINERIDRRILELIQR